MSPAFSRAHPVKRCLTMGCSFAVHQTKDVGGDFCCVRCRWVYEESEISQQLPEEIFHGYECERINVPGGF